MSLLRMKLEQRTITWKSVSKKKEPASKSKLTIRKRTTVLSVAANRYLFVTKSSTMMIYLGSMMMYLRKRMKVKLPPIIMIIIIISIIIMLDHECILKIRYHLVTYLLLLVLWSMDRHHRCYCYCCSHHQHYRTC